MAEDDQDTTSSDERQNLDDEDDEEGWKYSDSDYCASYQSVFRIRIIGPDPDPLQETLIRIRVAKKNRDKLTYKSTIIIRI